MYISWMVNSGTYYGLSLSASNLVGNPYYIYVLKLDGELWNLLRAVAERLQPGW